MTLGAQGKMLLFLVFNRLKLSMFSRFGFFKATLRCNHKSFARFWTEENILRKRTSQAVNDSDPTHHTIITQTPPLSQPSTKYKGLREQKPERRSTCMLIRPEMLALCCRARSIKFQRGRCTDTTSLLSILRK